MHTTYSAPCSRHAERVHLSQSTALWPLFFTDPATAEIYTLSLHDALPISSRPFARDSRAGLEGSDPSDRPVAACADRKSTRLNSSHTVISYAVFCLKKKKQGGEPHHLRQPHHRRRRRVEEQQTREAALLRA